MSHIVLHLTYRLVTRLSECVASPYTLLVRGIVQDWRECVAGERATSHNVKRTGKSYTVAQYVNYFCVPYERSGCNWTTKVGLPSNRHGCHDFYMLQVCERYCFMRELLYVTITGRSFAPQCFRRRWPCQTPW
eukprot:1741309-Pleurochrysis_carterae.AAC.3